MYKPISIKSISSLKAYKSLKIDKSTIINGASTNKKWQKINILKVDKNQVFCPSGRLLSDMLLNSKFILKVDKKDNVLFLCRSVVRSCEVVSCINSLGYRKCCIIINSFEGEVSGISPKHNNLSWQVL